MVNNLRTLVLNADFTPLFNLPNLHTISAQDAIVGILKDHLQQVAVYDRKVQCKSVDMYWPSVVALKTYVDKKRQISLNKTNLFYRDNGVCVYCGKPISISEVTKDHVIPRSKGGQTTWDNIVCSCTDCNNIKGNDESDKWDIAKKHLFNPSVWDILKNRKHHPIIIDDISWAEFLGDWVGGTVLRK